MRYLICLILCFGFAATAFAEAETVYSVVLKSGEKLTWHSLFPDGDSICTYQAGGTFCVNKTDVASYKGNKVFSTSPGNDASTAPSSDGQGSGEGDTYNGGTFTGRAKRLEKLLEK